MTVRSIERKAAKQMEIAMAAFRKSNEQTICTAYELGKAGYAAGIKAPASCTACMALIPVSDSCDFAPSAAICEAWNKGWHFAHSEAVKEKIAAFWAA